MIPLTRKENYLNEIVGWGNTAPEKPTTPEEFFFAAILGEAVPLFYKKQRGENNRTYYKA